MKRLLISAALIAAACTPQPAPAPTQPSALTTDAAGNRMEALNGVERACSEDGAWCVLNGETGVRVVFTAEGAEREIASFAAAPEEKREPWAFIVRQADGDTALVGLTSTQEQMYSGGGGAATFVTLYAVSATTPSGESARAVLTAPMSASLMIRACFDEEDTRARREACHDTYEFTGVLPLDLNNASGPARLLLTTEAQTAPGRRDRNTDSTQQPPLTEADLAPWRDETCSYRRAATFDATAGEYKFDQPLPPCTDYLEP
jgi:hypothetical protein